MKKISMEDGAISTLKEDYKMKIQEIREIAKSWGVDTKVGRSKQDIIRDIQISEGNEACFRTSETCGNDCLWKKDCINGK
jgi:hypothetical protein